MDGAGVGKTDLPLGGVDIEVRQGGIDFHVDRPHRMHPVGEPTLNPVFQGLE